MFGRGPLVRTCLAASILLMFAERGAAQVSGPYVSPQFPAKRVHVDPESARPTPSAAVKHVPEGGEHEPSQPPPRKLKEPDPTIQLSSKDAPFEAQVGEAPSPNSMTTPLVNVPGIQSNAFPPDTMGAVGPTQFLMAVNGRIRVFNKSNGTKGELDADIDSFFISVRGGEITGRNSAVVRFGLHALAERGRALAGDVAEGAPERAQAAPARVEGDLGDGQVGVAQQGHRPLDAPREQVPVRRKAEGLFERAREVGLGDAAHARQPPDGPVLVRGGVHPVLRAQQAPQQLGVLAHAPSRRPRVRACVHPNVPTMRLSRLAALETDNRATQDENVFEGRIRGDVRWAL